MNWTENRMVVLLRASWRRFGQRTAEERHDRRCEAFGDPAGVSAGINLELVRYGIAIQVLMQDRRSRDDRILVAHIDPDLRVSPESRDMLVEKGERRVSFKLYGARSVVEAVQPETLRVEPSKTDSGELSFNVILPPELEDKVFEDAAQMLRSVAAPVRLKIISALCHGEKNVSELLGEVQTTQSNMSQHLSMLYRAGILDRRREGVSIYYRIANRQVVEICRLVPSEFIVLSGDDALTLPMMAVGGRGVISVASNEVPAEMTQMVEAAERGDFTTARRWHAALAALMQVNFVESNPMPVKFAMAAMGLYDEVFRLPMVPPSAASKEKILGVLKEFGLPVVADARV